MGSATTICSDKTETLTLNQAYAGKNKISPPSDASQMTTQHSTLVIEGVAVNTTGGFFVPKKSQDLQLKRQSCHGESRYPCFGI
ncbi:hypothetical protein RND81_14G137000 [Saponaria officinalis]|uniref:Uncharacterized protein n=1 Tax=Saponaria officinalis TaxID=3572 RepID=A0AAW1GMU3_SAPOF